MEIVSLLVEKGGPAYLLAAAFLYLYLQERADHRSTREKLNETLTQFIERMVNAINATSQATRDVTAAMGTLNTTVQTVMMQLNRFRSDDGDK